MLIKLIMVCVSGTIGILVGKIFYKRYQNSYLYYNDLCVFIDSISQNLSFKQENLLTFIGSYSASSEIFSTQIENFSNYISSKGVFTVSITCISHAEKMQIEKFFRKLGTVDIFTQRDQLSAAKSEFEQRRSSAKNNLDKKGSMSIKLGGLIGLAVGILLI